MLTARLQHLLDEKVEGSPRARQLLAELEGRRLHIVARHTPWDVTLAARDGRLLLWRGAGGAGDAQGDGAAGGAATTGEAAAGAPTVTLSGTPLALMALLREDPATVIRRGDVRIAGDGEAGARFQELLQLLRPDLEAGLARIIGDVPARGMGALLQKVAGIGRATVATQAANIGEYLTHERRLLVPQAEARQFLDDVDVLREQTDRLAARVAQLEAREQRP